MPESIPAELVQLRQRAECFATEVLIPHQTALAAGQCDQAAVRDAVTRAARDSGFFAMTQPQSAGGSEAGLLALTVVRDTLA
jgi:alkylation response protein AidB-like acyl-CoA dehydrogenase